MNSIDKSESNNNILVCIGDNKELLEEFSILLESFDKEKLKQLIIKYYSLKLSEKINNNKYQEIEKLESITDLIEILNM